MSHLRTETQSTRLQSTRLRALQIILCLDRRFDIFYFLLLGGGEGQSEAPRRAGGQFLLKIPKRGGGLPGEGSGEGKGREGVCGEFFGGGAKYFFSGPKFPPSCSCGNVYRSPHFLRPLLPEIASERRFSLRFKRAKLIPTAEYSAIPESTVKNR